MATLKCKMCGGDLEISEDMSVAECEYCGTKQTVPKVDDEKKIKLFERANRLRTACEFDKAAGVYESIVADFDTEAEAYWGLILCKFGIEYVDDPATGKKVPTCHRSSFDSVMDDANFDLVMENSDDYSRRVYRDEAKAIEELRKRIIAVSSKEEPYDVFISYKELDNVGERTVDSVIAQDIYERLAEKGYRVFFSRISLEDKLGVEYEPYIFAALNSAKVMLVVGTDYDNFNAVWVKNEWSRFLTIMSSDHSKMLIPCFKGIDAYDMPKEFNKLAAQDMGKVGAMQDLTRGVEKILGGKKEEKPAAAVQHESPNVTSLLKRGMMFIEDEDWSSANEYFDKVLDITPENGDAYYGKLVVELETMWDGETSARKFAEASKNFKRLSQFGGEKRKAELEGIFKECEKKVYKQWMSKAIIKNNVFVKLKSKMATVHIPDGVTKIGAKAFYWNELLKEVHIPDGVTSIGNNAFYWCRALTEVHIPNSVTNIGDGAFRGCRALKEAHIPDGVIRIGNGAFSDCSALKKVTIPDSVTSIGAWAFDCCEALTEINIPDSVTSIGDGAFSGCDGLAGSNGFVIIRNVLYRYCGKNSVVTIPDGVTSIEAGAFSDCKVLKKVHIPDSVTSIGKNAFSDCKDLTEMHIPYGVTNIGNGAFDGCKALKEVHIPDSVTSIGDGAFSGCNGLADSDGFIVVRNVLHYYCGKNSAVTIPDGVTCVGVCAFEGCNSLKEVHIPNSVTSIGSSAFFDCPALKKVTIPDSVTSIGERAFWGCDGLADSDGFAIVRNVLYRYCGKGSFVTIPNGVTSIESYAFNNCSSLKEIHIPDSVTSIRDCAFDGCKAPIFGKIGSYAESYARRNKIGFVNVDSEEECLAAEQKRLAAEQKRLAAEKKAENEEREKCVFNLLHGGATIKNNVFVKLTSDMKKVYIPDGVTSIGYNAFHGCKALKKVTIPDSVTSIGGRAFEHCKALTEVNIPDSVTSIGDGAFSGCESLTEIHISDSVTSIGYHAFDGCKALKKVTIPDSVTSIGTYAFSYCKALTEVHIPDGVTNIGAGAFSHCESLTEVHIPDSVTSIGAFVFSDCTALKKVTIPDSVTSIEQGAFSGCDGLADSDGFAIIRNVLYRYCGKNSAVTIPGGVTSIGYEAFENCESLTEVHIPDSVTSIESFAFNRCESLTEIYIPDSVTSISDIAFSGCETMIISKAGTYAESYARKNNIKFIKFVSDEEQSALAAEKEKLTAELPNLQGMFKAGRRREVEARLSAIEKELKEIESGIAERKAQRNSL